LNLAAQTSPTIADQRIVRLWSALVIYGGTVLLSISVLFLSLQLWRADLRVPFAYTPDSGDAFLEMMYVKTIIQTGWTWHNPSLGAPGQLNQLDFPNPQGLTDAASVALSWFTHDFGSILNIYFLLTFPITALTATLAARQVGLGIAASILVAQLYTFLPFHFIRGETHLAYSAYYAVPLIIPSILSLAMGIAFTPQRRWTAVLGFVLTGFSNPYYTAFAAFFVCLAAIAASLWHCDRRAIKTAGALLLVLFVAFCLQMIPNLVHTSRLGRNPVPPVRYRYEGDLYGLRLTQMLLPVPGHRIPALAEFRSQFELHGIMINENESSALGIVGSIGVLYLLFRGLLRRPSTEPPHLATTAHQSAPHSSAKILDLLSVFMLAGVLLAAVGGLGPTANYLGFTALRSYNRISVFLGFFSLLAMGMLVERLAKARWRNKKHIEAGFCSLILALGLLDQISPASAPSYERNALDFRNDADFVSAIEAAAPGASIFQLPAMAYPESQPAYRLGDYQLFRGYLHSDTLRWSYGAMRGREASNWQTAVAKLPPEKFLSEIRAKGFAGLYLDRRGYADDSTEKKFQVLLGTPMVSRDQRLVFFLVPNPLLDRPTSAK
jgi:phosphoglycerol transferase